MIDKGVYQGSVDLLFQDEEAVQSLAEKHERILLIYEENVYDATEFADKHPGINAFHSQGGHNILEDYSGYDISEDFHDPKIHKHSGIAKQQMLKYYIGKIDEDDYKVLNIQNEVLTQYLIDYGEFQIDQSKPILSQIEKLNELQFQQMLDTNLQLTFIPRLQDDDLKKSIQFENTINQERQLWYGRNTIGEIQIITAILCLIILFIYNPYNLILMTVIAIISCMIDYRILLDYIKFNNRLTQFRYNQTCFIIKSYITKQRMIGEMSIIFLLFIPFLQIYAIIQLFILGIRNRRICKMSDKQFIK